MTQYVELKNNGLTLRGMLNRPDGITEKIPVVCMFHGYTGCRNEQHFLFVQLARRLERLGMASLRFDFGGSGESDGEFEQMTILKELEDAKAVLGFAKGLPFADQARIGVVGMSMGGAVASMLGGDCADEIAALCLWAPAANIAEICVKGRVGAIVYERERFVDVGGLKLGFSFIEEVKVLDIVERAKPYNKEVLLIHGTADPVVPLEVSHRYLAAYGKNAALVEVAGAGHTFDRLDYTEQVFTATETHLKRQLQPVYSNIANK